MGVYLNSKTPVSLFEEEANGFYFVDKTNLLTTLLQLFEQGNKYFCITRPRRFGKTMAAHMLASFLGTEVDMLYARYQQNQRSRRVTREGLRLWYDGYVTCTGERVYNPRSVVCALLNNNLGNYWTSAGPYDEIYFYLEKNIADVREPIARMVAKEAVPARIREYAATSQHLGTKDEIFSAMVVYGFLSYENGCVSIPNKELMIQLRHIIQNRAA